MSKVVYLCRLYIVRYNFIVRLFDLMKFENNMGTGIKIETIGNDTKLSNLQEYYRDFAHYLSFFYLLCEIMNMETFDITVKSACATSLRQTDNGSSLQGMSRFYVCENNMSGVVKKAPECLAVSEFLLNTHTHTSSPLNLRA